MGKARQLAEKYPGHIWWAAGLHPYFADQGSPEHFAQLQAHAQHDQFVAVGEVGLDYAKCPIPAEDQKKTFTKAIDLSMEVNKPLIIHCREAYADLMPILRSYQKAFSEISSRRSIGVIHCFSGDAQNAAELVEMGFFLGVDGPLTYPSANPLREALASVPLEHLVLETDSPYLPPQNYRGKRNEPSYLPLIAQKLADLRKMSLAHVGKVMTKNGHVLFGINPS